MKPMISIAKAAKRVEFPHRIPKSIVFLVDDDASVRRALARLIRSAGHQVQTFASAREFLDRIPDTNNPACLVPTFACRVSAESTSITNYRLTVICRLFSSPAMATFP